MLRLFRTFVTPLVALAFAGCGQGGSSTAPSAVPTPTPAPPDGFTVLAVGDIGQCQSPGPERTARIASWLLAQAKPSEVVRFHTLGDNEQSDGSQKAYEACFAPAWGQFRDFLYPAVGNHDWVTVPPYYFPYFGGRAIWNGKDGYYSYVEGRWLVLVLNSELLFAKADRPKADAQLDFVRRELAANTDKFVLAIWHRPRWGHGENGDTREVQEFSDALAGRTGITLHGHEHHYERFRLANGFRSFTVGTGGAFLSKFRNVRCDRSEFRHLDATTGQPDFGMLRLRLKHDGSYTWEFFTWPDGAPAPSVVDNEQTKTATCP